MTTPVVRNASLQMAKHKVNTYSRARESYIAEYKYILGTRSILSQYLEAETRIAVLYTEQRMTWADLCKAKHRLLFVSSCPSQASACQQHAAAAAQTALPAPFGFLIPALKLTLASVLPARHKLSHDQKGIPACHLGIGCKAAICKQLHLHSLHVRQHHK